MTQQTALPQSAATQDIPQSDWAMFCAEFTRENRGAHAQLEVFGGDIGRFVELEDRPFDGMATDTKDGENAVWMMFGATPENRLTHGIQHATAIRHSPPAGSRGAAVEIDAQDGTRTLLQLSWPLEYALPPAGGARS